MEKEVLIHTDYITLGQMLKLVDLVSTGGEEKKYLASHQITVNGELDNRRGRKLRPGDKVLIETVNYSICSSVK